MSKKLTVLSFCILITFFAIIFYVRPPGEPPVHEEIPKDTAAVESSLILSHGSLPGVTWIDDIHPIFVINKCGHCHTRGREVIAEGFEELALGIIDPDDENNAFYSYHELVYAEGPPQIQEGETLRDGQCCWPRNYPDDKQRRIWIGHPERSVLVRKLDRDYYDYEKPPRFFEEGLRLKWGPPMPMYREGEGGHEEHGSEVEGQRQYEIRPFYKRIFLNLSLWLGGSGEELRRWPQRIPERDRLLLRYWINNATQLMEKGTGIEVKVVNTEGNRINNAEVILFGNYNSAEKREVKDQLFFRTDTDGRASLYFPKYSVITSTWFITAEKDGIKSDYQSLHIVSGKVNKISLMLR